MTERPLEAGIWYGVNTGSMYSARMDSEGRIWVQRLNPNTLEPIGSETFMYPPAFRSNYIRSH